MYKASILLLSGVYILSSGCASIIHGTTQDISLSSNPSGVKVLADGNQVGETPVSVTLKRKTDHILVFNKEGYEQEQRTVMHVVSGAVYGNIAAGGLIGWGIDAATGAQYKLAPETISVVMQLAKGGSPETKTPVTPISDEDKLKELEKLMNDGQITKDEYNATRQTLLKTKGSEEGESSQPSQVSEPG